MSEVAKKHREWLSCLGNVTTKPMFGGYGHFLNGIIFAITVGDDLFLKVDEVTLPKFEAIGSEPFSFESNGKRMTMKYWKPPADANTPGKIQPWAEDAYEVALRAAEKKTKKR